MLSKEDFEKKINEIKDKIEPTTSALLSDSFLEIISNYNIGYDEIDKKDKEITSLKTDKDDLLKVNGKLFQKIGFDREMEDNKTIISPPKQEKKQEILISDLINEKGELI